MHLYFFHIQALHQTAYMLSAPKFRQLADVSIEEEGGIHCGK
jgi:hypothetical protein